MSFFRSIFSSFSLSYSFFLPDGVFSFYLVTTDWIFDISLCENSIKSNQNHGDNPLLRPAGIQIIYFFYEQFVYSSVPIP